MNMPLRACPIQKPIQLDPKDPGAPADAEELGMVVDRSIAWFPCCRDLCAAFHPFTKDPHVIGDEAGHCKAGGFDL